MNAIDRELINNYLVSRLGMLRANYPDKTSEEKLTAGEKFILERAGEIIKDWQEWESLDDESQKFVLEYIQKD